MLSKTASYHKSQKLRLVTCWDQFIGVEMSQLSGRQSLRDIESNLEAQQEKLYQILLSFIISILLVA